MELKTSENVRCMPQTYRTMTIRATSYEVVERWRDSHPRTCRSLSDAIEEMAEEAAKTENAG